MNPEKFDQEPQLPKPETKKLVVIRHGQSTFNLVRDSSWIKNDDSLYTQEFLDSKPDSWELTELGIEQAEKAGDLIRSVLLLEPLVYVSSNTARTRQTAGYAFPNSLLCIDEPLIKERSFANNEKLTKTQYVETLTANGIPLKEDSYDWKIIGGESARDLESRVKATLEKYLKDRSDNEYDFLFTHDNVIQMIRFLLHGMSEEDWVAFKKTGNNRVRNGQVFIFTIDTDTQKLISEETFFFEEGEWYKGSYIKDEKRLETEVAKDVIRDFE